MDKNLVSFTLTAADMQAIAAATTIIHNKAQPIIVALSKDERKRLPKMGDKTVAFVEKALEHALANPALVPPYIDVAELQKDVVGVQNLLKILNPLLQLCEGLDDTCMLAGSEAYSGALAFYTSVKGAMKTGVPMAKTIADDLGKRFTGHGGSKMPGDAKPNEKP